MPDVKVESLQDNRLTLRNNSNRPVSVQVEAHYADGTTKEILLSAAVWKEAETHLLTLPEGKVSYLTVNFRLPDASHLDNTYPSIPDIYRQFDIPHDLEGSYVNTQNPAQALDVTQKDGVLLLRIGGGLDSYLIPTGKHTFQSLDGAMQVQFGQADGKTKEVTVQFSRLNIKAVKG